MLLAERLEAAWLTSDRLRAEEISAQWMGCSEPNASPMSSAPSRPRSATAWTSSTSPAARHWSDSWLGRVVVTGENLSIEHAIPLSGRCVRVTEIFSRYAKAATRLRRLFGTQGGHRASRRSAGRGVWMIEGGGAASASTVSTRRRSGCDSSVTIIIWRSSLRFIGRAPSRCRFFQERWGRWGRVSRGQRDQPRARRAARERSLSIASIPKVATTMPPCARDSAPTEQPPPATVEPSLVSEGAARHAFVDPIARHS